MIRLNISNIKWGQTSNYFCRGKENNEDWAGYCFVYFFVCFCLKKMRLGTVLRCISSSNSVQPFPLPCFDQESILVTSKKMVQVHSMSTLCVFYNKRHLLHDVVSLPKTVLSVWHLLDTLIWSCALQILVLFMQPIAVHSS